MKKMAKTLRVAYLTLQATREGQAAYAHVHEIIRGLERRGTRVTLFSPNYSPGYVPGSVRRAMEFLRLQYRLLLELFDFDLVYVRNHFAAVPIVLAAKLAGIPTVQEINGPYADLFVAWPAMSKVKKLVVWCTRTQFRSASALIAVTPELAKFGTTEAKREIPTFVVPNAANTELFVPAQVPQHSIAGPYVLFFGALAGWQGVDVMLQAVKEPSWPKEVKLVIAGDGVDAEKVIKAAERVVYLGTVPYRRMPSLIAGALAGLSPQTDLAGRSGTGLSPLKLYEMMACGIPVIVSDFPAMADLVRVSGAGIVVPPSDPAALSEAVAHMYSHVEERQRMGALARTVVADSHSWDCRAERTLDIIRDAAISGSTRARRKTMRNGSQKHYEPDSI